MKFLNFFKKKKKKETPEIKKGISFSEIPSYLEEKEKENQIKEKEIFNGISEKITGFNKTIQEKIKNVEEVDLDLKKAEDKLKALTDLGRKEYIEYLENLIEEIKNTEKKDFKKFFEKIDRLFLKFNKSSRKNYERATILIGKEMSELKELIKNFSNNLARIFQENADIIELYKKINLIREKLNQIKKNKENCEKIKKDIKNLEEEINERKKEIEKINQKIKEIEKSEEHLKNLKAKEKIINFEKDLNKKLFDLQKLIDFKALGSFFHIFEDSMEIVKAHKENFKIEFEKDNGERILKLLEESKLQNNSIEEKVKEIKNKKLEITNCKKNLKKDKVEELLFEIEKIKAEISELNKEENKKNQIRENLKSSSEELKEEIERDVRNLGS